LILQDRGDLDGAMALHKEEERICRELGDKDGLSTSLGNQALILSDREDLDGAMALYKECERIWRELGNKQRLQALLGNQAPILFSRGDLDGAMTLFKEQERLCRELGNPEGLSISLANQASMLEGSPERRSEARRLADEALAIATRHGYQQLVPGIQRIRDSISSSSSSRWIRIPVRVFAMTFLSTLLSFAVALLLSVMGTLVYSRAKRVAPNLRSAYRHIALPFAITVGAIVLVLSLAIELRNYRQRKTREGIERVS
jgi:tetratricopeptide (TPR) repeat protein